MDGSILSVKHLTKQFGHFIAVNDISFSVKEGEIVGLLGPNGAGKSTTIFMLIDLITPSGGSIEIFGLQYPRDRERILQKMNYSSTYVEMTPRLSVLENLIVMAKLYRVKSYKKKIDELVDSFEVWPFLHKRHDDLSQGEKTRVSLCKAFLNDPKLLLLDEPTASLDPDVAVLVRRKIMDIREKGTTVLLTSHNMAEVEEVCDRVLFINKGKILAEDTPEELARKVRKVEIRLMLKDGLKRTELLARKSGFEFVSEGRFSTISIDERDIAYFLAGLAEIGVEYNEISIDKPTLEDYFIKMTRHTKKDGHV